MLSLIAAVVLTAAEPSAAAMAPRFVQVQAAAPGMQPTVTDPQDPYAGWTRPQLETEWRRLDDLRPSLGLPITLIAVGAAVCVIDAAVLFLSGFIALLGSSGLPVPLTAGIVVAAIAGAGMIIIGIILATRVGQDRRDLNAQIELVKAALEKHEVRPALPPLPDPEAPPPPPEVPLQVKRSWAPPVLMVTLARF